MTNSFQEKSHWSELCNLSESRIKSWSLLPLTPDTVTTHPRYFDVGRVVTHLLMLSFLAYQASFGQFQNVHSKCNL